MTSTTTTATAATPSIPYPSAPMPSPATAPATAPTTAPTTAIATSAVKTTSISNFVPLSLSLSPQPQPQPHPRPRSLHELRLEQIAIWGDAALYSSRSSATLRLSTPSHSTTPSSSQPRRLPQARTTIGTPLFRPAPSRIENDVSNTTSRPSDTPARRFPDPTPDPIPVCHPQSYTYNTKPISIPVPVPNSSTSSSQPHPNTPPSPPRRGSMSLCNSPSADAFHRSGTWAAQAQATLKNARKNFSHSTEQTSSTHDHDANHFFLTRRPSLNSVPLSSHKKSSPAPLQQPTSQRNPSSRDKPRAARSEPRRGGPLARLFSSESRGLKNRRPVETPRSSTSPSPSSSPSTSRSSSPSPSSGDRHLHPTHLRERDENDFRMSNAKLPQRDDDHFQHQSDSSHFSTQWHLRPRRFLTPTFGRYSRSRMSRLPNPPAASSNGQHPKSGQPQPRHSHNLPPPF